MRSTLFVLFAFALSLSRAEAADLYLKYKLYAVGLPIGSGTVTIDFDKDSYALSAKGGTAAFGKLVSNGKGSVTVRGRLEAGALTPQVYDLKMTSDDDSGTVSMRLKNGSINKVAVHPPQDRMNERVKVTAAHLANVLDPLTAAVFPAPKGLAAESCNRTLRLYDGKERYDVHLSYKGKRETRTSDGRFKGKVLICRVRYEPVSGHRPKRKTIQQLAKNKSMEIWLGQVGKTPFLVPLRASITAPFGPLVVEAEKYKLSR